MARWMAFAEALALASCGGRAVPLPEPPEVRAHNGVATLTLKATRAADWRCAFEFNGRNVPPTIRVWPGEWLEIHYVNALPGPHGTAGHTGPMNITNLHFHGL